MLFNANIYMGGLNRGPQVNFVPAVACRFCLNLPEKFSQPRSHLLAQHCTYLFSPCRRCLRCRSCWPSRSAASRARPRTASSPSSSSRRSSSTSPSASPASSSSPRADQGPNKSSQKTQGGQILNAFDKGCESALAYSARLEGGPQVW